MVKIICALGNPGARYRETRHNLGFMVFERLGKRLNADAFGQARFFDVATVPGADGSVHLIRPLTYVNRSGQAVLEALERFGATAAEFFVIVDDYHLELGRLRIRRSGTSGGHNGLTSIIEEIGTTDFPRLRLGIGPLPPEIDAAREKVPEFVLSRFRPEEREIVEAMTERAAEAVELVIKSGLDLAISTYNSANPTPDK